MDFKFDHIEYLHLLWGVLLLAGVYVYGFSRKARALRVFATANLLGQLMPTVSPARQRLKAGLVLGAMALLVVAATGPRWGKDIVDLQRRGIDLMVCLDVSRSMLAEDIAPNRLERAKLEIGDMLREMHGDRVGLVTFAGDAALTCPLTINYGAYRMSLEEVSTRSTGRGGTHIGDAVRVAVRSFTDKVKGHKAILVITDGEDQNSFPVKAAQEAYDHGIRVFTVGFGDQTQGARIPITVNGQKQFLQYQGQEVWSRMDPQTLQEMAVEGGGTYFGVGTREADFAGEVYDRIRNKVEAREFESSRRELYRARFHWFAGAALILLLLETLITDRKRPIAEPMESW